MVLYFCWTYVLRDGTYSIRVLICVAVVDLTVEASLSPVLTSIHIIFLILQKMPIKPRELSYNLGPGLC